MFVKIVEKAKWVYKYAKNHLTEALLVTGFGCGGGILLGRWGALLGVAAGVGLLILANKVKD